MGRPGFCSSLIFESLPVFAPDRALRLRSDRKGKANHLTGISQSTSVLFQDGALLPFGSQLRRNGDVEASWVRAVISIRARACGEVDRVSGGDIHD